MEQLQLKFELRHGDIQPGMRVRVARKVEDAPDWDDDWVKNMDDTVGKEFTVEKYRAPNRYYLIDSRYGYDSYNYPIEALELA